MEKLVVIRRVRVVIFAVAACLFMIGAASRSLRPSAGQVAAQETIDQSDLPVVRSKVSRLTIVEVKKRSHDSVEVTVRNDYDKDITGVAASADDPFVRSAYYREYLIAAAAERQKLSPGASDVFYYQIPSAESDGLFISAVVFADRTSEGDERDARRILDCRRGEKIQLRRVLPHLRRLGNAPALSARSELATLRAIVESLRIETDDGSPLSSGLSEGLTAGRSSILKYVAEMEEGINNEKVDTWYLRNRERKTVRYSPYEHFRMKLDHAEKYLTAYESRL